MIWWSSILYLSFAAARDILSMVGVAPLKFELIISFFLSTVIQLLYIKVLCLCLKEHLLRLCKKVYFRTVHVYQKQLKPLAVMVFFFYVRNLSTKLSESGFFFHPRKMVALLIGISWSRGALCGFKIRFADHI